MGEYLDIDVKSSDGGDNYDNNDASDDATGVGDIPQLQVMMTCPFGLLHLNVTR